MCRTKPTVYTVYVLHAELGKVKELLCLVPWMIIEGMVKHTLTLPECACWATKSHVIIIPIT